MPKPSPKPLPPLRSTDSTMVRRHRLVTVFVAVILVLVLGIAGVHIYNHYAVKADRARFTRAEQDISSLSSAIIASTGQPLKVTDEKSCSRPSMELNNGILSCEIGETLFYGTADNEIANSNYQNIGKIIGTRWILKDTKSSGNLSDSNEFEILPEEYIPNRDFQQIFQTYSMGDKKMNCPVTYNFYKASSPPYEEFYKTTQYYNLLAISISCNDYAKSQYYPLNH